MENYFQKVREYLLELGHSIVKEDENDEVFVINNEKDGITNLVIGCAYPILIMEQYLVELGDISVETLKKLLQKNREIVHGAFALEESGSKLIFRDTLQLENLDINELEGTLNSLSLLLTEFSDELITIAKKN